MIKKPYAEKIVCKTVKEGFFYKIAWGMDCSRLSIPAERKAFIALKLEVLASGR
jgi:hypothetical protein